MNSECSTPVNRLTGKMFFLFNLKTSFFRLFEWIGVVFRYYRRSIIFLKIDLLLVSQYLFKSPHRLSKMFLQMKGAKNIYAYGETPLTTMDHIARECRILSHDVLLELGCGPGRSCFWLNRFVKCRVIGIDYLPDFIEKAKRVKRGLRLSQIDFFQENMLSTDLHSASVIYLYGTCLDDEFIEQLIVRFQTLREGTKVITVSYPLTEYCSPTLFRVEKQFIARFPWGKASIFLNIKR